MHNLISRFKTIKEIGLTAMPFLLNIRCLSNMVNMSLLNLSVCQIAERVHLQDRQASMKLSDKIGTLSWGFNGIKFKSFGIWQSHNHNSMLYISFKVFSFEFMLHRYVFLNFFKIRTGDIGQKAYIPYWKKRFLQTDFYGQEAQSANN